MPDTTNLRERLIHCFGAVFGSLSREDITRASVTSVGAWDSVATVTLAALVEEEFNIQFDPAELEQLTSFELVFAAVQNHGRVSG
jgi:acyl carrier protein